MAKIILEPGEVFEHTHDTDTTTGLVSGEVELRIRSETIRLELHRKVKISAHTPHSIVNIGNEEAVCRCHYNCGK